MLHDVAAARDCWEWAAKRVGSMGVDGGLAWSWALPAIKLPSGEAIPLEVALQSPERFGRMIGTEVEWGVPQLTTCLAPRQEGRWAWRSPNGITYLLESPCIGAGLGILVGPDGSGCITLADGWRFFYRAGSLYRILSPKNVMLRVTANGPRIERIELGPISRPTVLLTADFARDTGHLQRVETPAGAYSFLGRGPGMLSSIVDQHGEEVVRLSYANGAIDSIHVGGQDALPVLWRKFHWWEIFAQSTARRDFVLGAMGGDRYDFDASAIATTITATTGTKATRMSYNNYTGRTYYHEIP